MSAGSSHALRQTGTGSLNGVGYTPYPCQPPPPRLSGALIGFTPRRTTQRGQGLELEPATTIAESAVRFVTVPARQDRF